MGSARQAMAPPNIPPAGLRLRTSGNNMRAWRHSPSSSSTLMRMALNGGYHSRRRAGGR